jgi:hypothetical protein
MRLKQFVYTDSQGTGLEMFRMLAPAGWRFQGGCCWLLDNPGMPAVVNLQLGNPQGAEAFEILPNMNFTWNNNPMTRMMFPVGSRYFGAEVRPPMTARATGRLPDVQARFNRQVQGTFNRTANQLIFFVSSEVNALQLPQVAYVFVQQLQACG